MSTQSVGGWSADADSDFRVVADVHKKLPAGTYRVWISGATGNKYFHLLPNPTDAIADLPGLPSRYLLDQINFFWSQQAVYERYHFLHKRGILMYGPPGCGKTSLINLLIADFLRKYDGIVVAISDFDTAPKCLLDLRRAEPDRPIMTLMEDVEGIFAGQNGPTQVQAALAFLDGQTQLSHIVHVATTNAPETLADRFIKRPGRFDLVIGIHAPLAETREAYLRLVSGNQISEEKLQEMVMLTEGMGLSYLRELASTHLCLNIPLAETLDRLKTNFKVKAFLSKGTPKMGFSIGFDGE